MEQPTLRRLTTCALVLVLIVPALMLSPMEPAFVTAAAAHGSYTLTSTIPVGPAPIGVAVDPLTDTVYVVNSDTSNLGSNCVGTVSVIDGTTNAVTATVPVETAPVGIAVNPTTNLIYVANSDYYSTFGNFNGDCEVGSGDSISVIDGATNTVVATIPSLGSPLGVAVNSVTNMIYVTNTFNSSTSNLAIINGATNSVVANIPMDSAGYGYGPIGVAVDQVSNTVYVTQSVPPSLSVIDGLTNKLTATIPLANSDPEAVYKSQGVCKLAGSR